MKIVAIKDGWDGNESVGEMWQETKIFDSEQPISDIFKWVSPRSDLRPTEKRITITVPHNEGD